MIMVTITIHFLMNIFQAQHFSAMEFYKGYEKNMSFLVIPKSPEVERILPRPVANMQYIL